MEDKINYPDIIEFLRSNIKRETGFLKELEEYASIHHIPIIQPESAALLKILVKLHRPQKILEAGTAIGYSACILAEAMDKSGIIDTIEIDEEMADIAKKNIQEMGYNKRIRVLLGDALEVMECLNSSYDMIFLDAAKGQYNEYLVQSLRLLKPGGLLVSDNILYKGLVAQKEKIQHKHRTIAVNLREYIHQICSDNRLETAIIPIGDGMAVSIKKGS
ncbi:MAG: O-methyltransferase [Acetivibrionales bacterium]|jgi:predicted O-methyltransferase YrrM|nr:O-methyltransferase [Clostridiaceae bacterium]